MNMMNAVNLGNTLDDRPLHLVAIEPRRCPFEENVRTLLHQRPGTLQDQERDGDRQQGVDRHPARVDDDDGRNDRGHGTQQVAGDVQRSTADIEVVLVTAMQHDESNHVDGQSRRGHKKHRRAGYLDRRDEAPHRFEENPADDDQQAQAVDERGQDLETLVAEGAPRVRRAFADVERDRRERQGHRVGEHVARVCQQGERSGEDTADDLDDHEGPGERQRDDDALHIAAAVLGCHR